VFSENALKLRFHVLSFPCIGAAEKKSVVFQSDNRMIHGGGGIRNTFIASFDYFSLPLITRVGTTRQKVIIAELTLFCVAPGLMAKLDVAPQKV
jgi:hypothetical protein